MNENEETKKKCPYPKLRPFLSLLSGGTYDEERISGKEYITTCAVCSKEKLYINIDSGQFSCKIGSCALSRGGNIYSFLNVWYDHQKNAGKGTRDQWAALAKDRGIKVQTLQGAGVVWDGWRWCLPIRNLEGKIVNIRFYRFGKKMIGCAELDVYPWNYESLNDSIRKDWNVYQCEGEWDGVACQAFLDENNIKGVAIGLPGASILKEDWLDPYKNRNVVHIYDNDLAGSRGLKRAFDKLKGVARYQRMVKWPEGLKEGYDFRDFYSENPTDKVFRKLCVDYEEPEIEGDYSSESATDVDKSPQEILSEFPALSSGDRPSFEKVVKQFKKAGLHLTPVFEDAIKVVFAVVISSQLDGDPLWCHIVGAPGSGKTEALMAVSTCQQVFTTSTVTTHSLVSGFQLGGGKDPSLIPKLFGKTLIIKDFTEVLGLPKGSKDEIYSILTGAYDGRTEKTFGNGIRREYHGYFSIVTGVTPKVYGEKSAVVGERFLLFHLPKNQEDDLDKTILAAIKNVGNETSMKEIIGKASKEFLEYRVDRDKLPNIPNKYVQKIRSLGKIIAMLRGAIEKDHQRDHVHYRPEYETGTRPAKQLAKLFLSLALLYDEPEYADIFRIVRKVAQDSCVGWNIDAVKVLALNDGLPIQKISERARIPHSTLRNQLEELVLLGVVRRQEIKQEGFGRPQVSYWMMANLRKYWEDAGFPIRKLDDGKKKGKGK